MVPNSTPAPSRIALARSRRGLTKITLANRAGISTRSLYDIETGKSVPSAQSLAAIAEVTRFPMAFFYRAEVEAPTPDAASFRSLRSMTAGQRDAALAAGAIAFEISDWISARFELPHTALPDLQDYDPEAASIAFRAHLGIGERPIGNMIHLLESLGVRVFSMTEDRRVDAFSLWHRDAPFVFLNTVKTAEHSRMDAAHELAHLLLHRHGGRWGRDIEKDAQAFASAFLMPRASLLSMPRLSTPTMSHLVQIKKRWLVSAAALAHRMHGLQLISAWSYRNLCIQLAKFGRTKEPEGMAREASQVMAKVFGTSEGSASKAEAARDLSLLPADVEALVFGLRAEPHPDAPRRVGSGAPKPPRVFRVV